ncbi:MAG: AMP-binding protein [Alphaproteobacteria bacterium]|nr:AMP-binding protein [Alphaproteobacteria bacterium]MBT4082598.1 AMP-binding protein [Alphaproteobacteria bacterium]MBT4545860.1 AMP-binding protein [Alphaproteobacteria bacterium]MBT7746365.1 AMP-binding protein [Alphaproteobacteria bacterium]
MPAQNDAPVLETTVGGLLREVAAEVPDLTSLVEVTMEGVCDRTWTYGQMLGDAEKLALALSTRFEPGERVAVWSPNTPEWVIMEFACALAGLVLVTVNPAYQAKELDYVLQQSESVALFLTEEYRGNPMAEIAATVCAKISMVREVTILEDTATLHRHEDRAALLPEVTPYEAAQIQYTSGTTGFPKGAVLHHRGLTNNARLVARRLGVAKGDRWLNFMPMFHTSGCGIAALGVLQSRATIYVAKIFDPAAMNSLIAEQKITFMLGVPTMLIGMLEAHKAVPTDFSSIRVAVSGGSMVPPELIRRVQQTIGCGFETVYGQTETSPVVTQTRTTDAFEDVCDTVGQPLPGIAISIRAVETNQVVALGDVGEICSHGHCNMIGYNGNAEATAETIDEDGWLHTGDLGTMDSRGFVRVTGRVKEMIIRGGENLFPVEIENVLQEHPCIAEVAIVGLPDEKWGEIVACFFRPESGQNVDRQELAAHCRTHLSAHKTPVRWFSVEEFPLTGSGKIQKFALRDGYANGDYQDL